VRGVGIHAGEIALARAETILIAVGDGVLADSLRFSLELEGYSTRFCEEPSLLRAMSAPCVRGGCLVLDQDVFARMIDGERGRLFADRDMPVVLMVSHITKRVRDSAAAAGVTAVVEKPLLGGILFDVIRQALDGGEHSGGDAGP
jgi:FixJ family two-component response regulator